MWAATPTQFSAGQANHGCNAWASRSCCLRYKVVLMQSSTQYAPPSSATPPPSIRLCLTHFPSKICLPCWMRANICETLLNRATTRTSYFIFATVSCGRLRGGRGWCEEEEENGKLWSQSSKYFILFVSTLIAASSFKAATSLKHKQIFVTEKEGEIKKERAGKNFTLYPIFLTVNHISYM